MAWSQQTYVTDVLNIPLTLFSIRTSELKIDEEHVFQIPLSLLVHRFDSSSLRVRKVLSKYGEDYVLLVKAKFRRACKNIC